jgi:hypothetical protein
MEFGQEEIIEFLAEAVKCDPEILRDLPMVFPNIATPTMGGTLFWEDVAEIKGWRVQQNIFTGHWRLLDPKNMRQAWGADRKAVDIFVKAARSGSGDDEVEMPPDHVEGEEGDDISPDAEPPDEEIDTGKTRLGT